MPNSMRPEVRALVTRCLHADPVQRPPMTEVVRLLEAIVQALQPHTPVGRRSSRAQPAAGTPGGEAAGAAAGQGAAADPAGSGGAPQGCGCVIS
jgi:hypothetical protein